MEPLNNIDVIILICVGISMLVAFIRGFVKEVLSICGLAIFAFLSIDLTKTLFNVETMQAVSITLTAVVIGDCIMTMFGSTANDASFNAWVTDNTKKEFRGTVEGVLSILPLVSMLIVAGGFGILVELLGYSTLFLISGIVISLSGLIGLFVIKDSPTLEKSGTFKDIFY